jgi:membrane protein DedA with SNARE-associated domain
MQVIYLYFALFLGTFLEGEATLIAAGFASHRKLLNPYWVCFAALLGVQATDWFHFLLGRYAGSGIIERKPWLKLKLAKVNNYILRNPRMILFTYRFMYGTRTVLHLAIGMSGIPIKKFAVFSLLGAACWSIIYTLLGYFAGHTMTLIFGEIKHYEWPAILSILMLGLIFLIYKKVNFKYRYFKKG